MENKLNLTLELLEKAKSATSAAALLVFAQENDITLTAEEAVLYFAQLHPKACALSDEELDSASGGILVTLDADGNYIPVSKVPMPKSDARDESISARMLENIKNAPPIDPLPCQTHADFVKRLQGR